MIVGLITIIAGVATGGDHGFILIVIGVICAAADEIVMDVVKGRWRK